MAQNRRVHLPYILQARSSENKTYLALGVFKLDTSHLAVKTPFEILEQMIDPSEEVWFFVNGDKDKFWFYQGRVKAIRTVILESCYIDEVYLVSKKYEWLICINHHDNLIATGKIMAEKLRTLSNIEP